MKCKHCQTELEEDCKVCPECGNEVCDGEEKTEALIQVTPGKFALTVAACVLLLAILVALVIGGANKRNQGNEISAPATSLPVLDLPSEPTQPATVPQGTGKDDVTFLGTYYVSDADAIAAADTVVARVGEKELTNGELQVYYWMQVRQFLNSDAVYEAMYAGLDYTKPLDTQICLYDETMTWHQYFLQQALNAWYSYQAMAIEAEEAGYEMEAELKADLEKLPEILQEGATAQGYENTEAMLLNFVGPGADMADYLNYENAFYLSSSYYRAETGKINPSDEEVAEYFKTYADEYAALGLTEETKTVNVRHILILPEGATIETIRTETFSEEAWAAGKAQAEELLKQWQRKPTEKNFAALANKHSADSGSNTNGGLYTEVYPGQMVTNFNDWCFNPVRKVGDVEIVQTEFGFHIMYYSGETPLWPQYAKQDLITDRQNAMVQKIMDEHPIEADYAAMKLAQISLT